MTLKKLSLVTTLFVLLAGCSSVKLSENDRRSIKTVRISHTVPLPDDIFWSDRATSMAIGLGAGAGVAAGMASGASAAKTGAYTGIGTGIGVVAAAQLAKTPKEAMKNTIATNHIDQGDIFRQSFATSLASGSSFVVTDDQGPADAEVHLSVTMYGFGQTQGFSSVLYPTLSVAADMSTPDGRVVWKDKDFITPLSKQNSQGHTFEEYMGNPELVRATLQNVYSVLSNNLVDDLSGK